MVLRVPTAEEEREERLISTKFLQFQGRANTSYPSIIMASVATRSTQSPHLNGAKSMTASPANRTSLLPGKSPYDARPH